VIAGAVGGSVGALLIAATIFLVLKRRQKPSASKSEGNSSSSSQNVYGQLSVISAPARSEYDVGNVTLPPESTD
jgi:hypothetical protein